jgi:Cu2+-exporting ATPase
VAVGLLAESGVPILPLLLLGSSITMLRGAFEAFTRQSHLTVDVLDARRPGFWQCKANSPWRCLWSGWSICWGDFIRHQTVRHAQSAVKEVLAYRRYPAWLLQDGKKIRVSIEAIQIGDTIVVYPGERIPVDGEVMEGQATVDQQALTGESVPVEKGPGAQVYVATVVQEGHLYVRAHRIGQHTEAATVVRLVEEAPIQETRAQNYAEQWANGLVPYSFAAAALSGAAGGGLQGAASLLIIDYGTGIRVAAPTTVLAAMTKALRHGILIKGGRYLEQLAEIIAISNTVALSLAFCGILGPGASTLLSNGSAIFAAGNALRPLFHGVPQDYKKARVSHPSADPMADSMRVLVLCRGGV